MTQATWNRRRFLGGVLGTGAVLAGSLAVAQERGREGLKQPVLRVANNPGNQGGHPLDPAIEIAERALDICRRDIKDYTCTLVKRERVKGTLGNHEYMYAKIRNGKVADGRAVTNFGVYLYFLKPEEVKAREVLYIENENAGKLLAKEGGIKGKLLPSVWLKPDSPIAMAGNLYPITDIGLENLVVKLIERANREKKAGMCDVQFMKDAKINGRVCTLLQVKHDEKKPEFDFHLAQIFIDDELQIPIRYAAYSWPEKEGATPPLLEEYTYLNLKINPGLDASEFDPKNPNYKFH